MFQGESISDDSIASDKKKSSTKKTAIGTDFLCNWKSLGQCVDAKK
jgi:hypothetical protein